MRALLLSVGLLGLALLFAVAESAPASTQRVTSDDVELASERTLLDIDPRAGKNGNQGRHGNGSVGKGFKAVK
jgi:hypothetical protein